MMIASRPLLLISSFLLVLVPAQLMASEATGRWQLALKISMIEFVGEQAAAQGIDRGTYAAIEAYYRIFPNIYLGGEIGGTGIDNGAVVSNGGIPWEAGFDYESYEFNLKHSLPFKGLLDLEVGGGVAMVSAGNVVDWVPSVGVTKTYYGAQGFAGLNLSGEHWYSGLDAKYQLVEEDYENWRGGAHIGYRFY